MTIINELLAPLLKPILTGFSRTRLPKTTGSLHLPGLHAPVEIFRDKWAVPHIFGQNTEDVLFAQGFVHAQERLWQMDINRRVTAGRISEVLGEAALPVDRVMRTLGLRQVAEQEALLLGEPYLSELQAYCAGANVCIQYSSKRLPLEFSLLGYTPEPWQVADIMAWNKLMSFTLSANWESELLRGRLISHLGAAKVTELEVFGSESWPVFMDLEPDSPIQGLHAFTGPGPGHGIGSNNWVIAPERSASGNALLANDMHLALSIPGIWFENHLCGGGLDITGVSLPGVPLVVAGHNQNIALGFTNGFTDVQDLYEEHLRQAEGGGLEYEYKGDWLPVETRHEQIHIKGGVSVVEEVLRTHHGPIINILLDKDDSEPPMALRWTAFEPETTVQALYHMARASNCYEFRQALRTWSGPLQNTVYADTQGNIAYSLPGRIPLRAQGDGSIPSPGWSGTHEWLGCIPFEELPHVFNPPQGYIVTANNRVVGPEYKYFLSRDYVYGDRAQRITELITAREKVDIAYIQRMHFDQLSPTARTLARYVGQLTKVDPELDGIIDQMRKWDGTLAVDSPAAALHEVLIRQVLTLIVRGKLGKYAPNYRGKSPITGLWGSHSWERLVKQLEETDSSWFDLGSGENRDDLLKKALLQAIDILKKELGPDPCTWAWGKLHKLTFGHILARRQILAQTFDRGPYPIGGDGSTIWATTSNDYDLANASVIGPPFRFIADLGDLDHTLGLLAPGQSGHPGSPHYDDGIRDWFEAGYHVMLFNRQEIERAAKEKLTLMP